MTLADLSFPVWLRATHWINVLFIGFLLRSGIQILAAYPRLYWNEHSTPGTEWLKFTGRRIPTHRVWTTLDQEVPVSSWIAQPGGTHLGIGRHWHFFGALFWLLNGLAYVVLLFATGEWQRLIPTSWSVFPEAWHTFLTYLSLSTPPPSAFHPYDPLQQLAYAAVVFLLTPFQLLTGAAQSPAIEARFPWYARLFGGRQSARSLHFLGLVAFVAFIVVHTVMVAWTGLARNLNSIIFGGQASDAVAVVAGLAIIAAILLVYALTTWLSLARPRWVQVALATIIRPVVRPLALRPRSVQRYAPSDISPFFLVNGEPPSSPEYLSLLWSDFLGWRLEVSGLCKRPLSLSLDDLRTMPKQTQITKHNCIQGWTGIAEWGGVRLIEVLSRCEPLPNARYLVFRSYSADTSGRQFYETLDISLADNPQTILAYEMNGQPLPVPHGAPLRLRVETQLGFKMVKWLRSIELVESYAHIRDGQGGSREDNKYYEQPAGI